MSLRRSPGGRTYWVTKPLYLAECQDCTWISGARNAKGNAARHHDATGHRVWVEEVRVTVYETEESFHARES